MYLKECYHKGFLAGPRETEEEFRRRIEKTEDILKKPELLKGLPPGVFTFLTPSLLCLRSSKKLPFWFGGMTLILEIDKISLPVLQLPEKKRLSWISEEEIVTHETIHALRAAFEEPKFEEILAYRTSLSPLRRYLGPLFQRDREAFLFMVFALVGVVTPLPLIAFSLLLSLRLIFRQKTFLRALKHLARDFSSPEKVIECLTDREILLYAKNQESLIDRESLRWQQIQQVFR